jgi:hypothetical protein
MSTTLPHESTPAPPERVAAPTDPGDPAATWLSAAANVARQQDLAKWFFTAAAGVGTLGAAFSALGAVPLNGLGRQLFVLAVLFVGVALVLAALALRPTMVDYPALPGGAEAALQSVANARAAKLRWATIVFALALALAAVSPFFSGSPALGPASNPRFAVSYSVTGKGEVSAAVSGSGLPAFARVAAYARPVSSSQRTAAVAEPALCPRRTQGPEASLSSGTTSPSQSGTASTGASGPSPTPVPDTLPLAAGAADASGAAQVSLSAPTLGQLTMEFDIVVLWSNEDCSSPISREAFTIDTEPQPQGP